MSAHFDTILFFINLACNLLLFGILIGGGLIIAFRLVENASQRLRYTVAVTSFFLAALLPIAVMLNGSVNSTDLVKSNIDNYINVAVETFSSQTSYAALNSVSANQEPEKTLPDSLNDFTAAFADCLLGKFFCGLWIIGTIVLVSRDIVAFWQLRKARQSWRAATFAEREELAVPDKFSLYFGAESPATIGFFYPLIVLPEKFPEAVSLASKRYIVQHEMSHARWRDPLFNFILRLIRSLLWISPALWMLERIIADERESAADQSAVANYPENASEREEAALDYATTLVSIAKHFNFHAPSGTNTVGLYNGSILENRVRRLLNSSSKPSALRIFSATLVFAVSFAGVFFMPVVFHADELSLQLQAAASNDSEAPEIYKDMSEPSVVDRRNKLPLDIENAKKSERYAIAAKEKTKIPPQLVWANQQPLKNFRNQADDDSEESMRKLSEEDAKAAGINQRIAELKGNVRNLNEIRKNLESGVPQVRQKAAGQIDMLLQKGRTNNNSVQKSN